MEHNTQQSKHSTGRRSFLRKGLAVGGAGAIGAGLLANGLSLPAFAEESSSSLTKGDVAILRLLAAVEIIESDLWQQYNELGGIQDSEVPGGSGSAPYVAGLLVLDGVYWLLSISVPKSNIEDGCISSFSSSTIHWIDGDTFLHNDFFPDNGTDAYVASTRRFSGSWYDQGAIDYIQKVKTTLADKTWMQAGFSLYW